MRFTFSRLKALCLETEMKKDPTVQEMVKCGREFETCYDVNSFGWGF